MPARRLWSVGLTVVAPLLACASILGLNAVHGSPYERGPGWAVVLVLSLIPLSAICGVIGVRLAAGWRFLAAAVAGILVTGVAMLGVMAAIALEHAFT